jgi:thymidylate synthase (FAD)
MIVKVIQKTNNPADIMWIACKTCYSDKESWELHDDSKNTDAKTKEDLVLKVLKSGHQSIAEHVYLTFTLDGMSRKSSHQLVRHRIATYSQKSQRYVTYHKPFKYNTPDAIIGNFEARELFDKSMKESRDTYAKLLNLGINAEDARDVFPNACQTSIVMSCNLREFISICNLRLCLRAQQEIRDMFGMMKDELLKDENYHFLKEFFVPKCAVCTEFDRCDKNK